MMQAPKRRYYSRREANGFRSVMPLQGPYCGDAVVVNEFTARVLEWLDGGRGVNELLELLRRENPEQDERKLRGDLFHTVARLGKHQFLPDGGFASSLEILQADGSLITGSVQPCPVARLPEVAELMRQGCGNGAFVYHAYATEAADPGDPRLLEPLYQADRLVEQHVTGGEVFWVYADDGGEIAAAASSSNYMHMRPVVTVHSLVVAGDHAGRLPRAHAMLSGLVELLSLFGVNEKARVTSCPASDGSGRNVTVLDEVCWGILADAGFRKAASFKGELDGRYDVEYYERLL